MNILSLEFVPELSIALQYLVILSLYSVFPLWSKALVKCHFLNETISYNYI